jgi:hypothetical protein
MGRSGYAFRLCSEGYSPQIDGPEQTECKLVSLLD